MYAITVNAPENIPYSHKSAMPSMHDGGGTAPPAPAMARPMISATDVGARPQIKEPTSTITFRHA